VRGRERQRLERPAGLRGARSAWARLARPITVLVIALALPLIVRADDLPAAKRVPLELAANGLPVALQGFTPRTPDIVPHESGCGMLEARAHDGRDAVIVFDPGTAEAWGGVLLYIITGPDAEVLEWAGDPDPAACRGGQPQPAPPGV